MAIFPRPLSLDLEGQNDASTAATHSGSNRVPSISWLLYSAALRWLRSAVPQN